MVKSRFGMLMMKELDAYDEMIDEKGGDTILWFWDKYKAQEGIIE